MAIPHHFQALQGAIMAEPIPSPRPAATKPHKRKRVKKRWGSAKWKRCLFCNRRYLQTQAHQIYCSGRCATAYKREQKVKALVTRLLEETLQKMRVGA